MPLIVLCGYPSSGKSLRAREIAEYIRGKTSNYDVHLINDENLGIRKEEYSNSNDEKKARGELLSAVQRHLTKNDIVIADSLNYIKGFRYQLYCTVREVGTTQCTVYCVTTENEASMFNEKRGDSGYDKTTLNELISRFEEPIYNNRWDKPLIVVHSGDETPCEAIFDSLKCEKSCLKPTLATMPKVTTPTDYIYELDRITQGIVNDIKDTQSNSLSFTLAGKNVSFTRISSLLELTRIRRKFISIYKMNPINSIDIGPLFIEYLKLNINNCA